MCFTWYVEMSCRWWDFVCNQSARAAGRASAAVLSHLVAVFMGLEQDGTHGREGDILDFDNEADKEAPRKLSLKKVSIHFAALAASCKGKGRFGNYAWDDG